jgi:hypothetical protein
MNPARKIIEKIDPALSRADKKEKKAGIYALRS